MDMTKQEHYQSNNINHNQHGAEGSGGLLRFHSAPSSFFSSNLESNESRIMSNRFMDDDHPDFEDKPSPSLLVLQPPPPPQHGIELPPQYPKIKPIRSSGLARQSSSPAGFLSGFNNGYAPVGGIGNFRMGHGTTGEVSTSPNRLPSRMQSSSSLGLLSRISEVDDEGMDGHCPTSISHMKLVGSSDVPFFRSAYPVDSWDDSAQFLENSWKMLPDSQTDHDHGSSRPRPLSHHLSLPKTSTELSTMEKLMQFTDYVPCKIRAKRGCATHPRSIAERVRRSRISERMRKLQELVPNMDKQTNTTSDMLDLAVDHIKDLQTQFKILSEKRENCKCESQLLNRQQPF